LRIIVDRTPQIHLPAADPDEHLVEMPAPAGAAPAAAKPGSVSRAEFGDPLPDRLVGDIESTLGQQLLDVAIAQAKPDIEPDRVLDDDLGKAVAGIEDRPHPDAIAPNHRQPPPLT
jgi:hypothetical protein